jgi:8-oxo-dGTP pyrophosphatase MutT (NUDIX family)
MKKQTTIIIGIKGDKVLLGMKKRGHGEGYWNGFGGKRNEEETIVESALREIKEEAGIIPTDLREVGTIDFSIFESYVYVFSNYKGRVKESEEMKPKWFSLKKLPYEKMWEGDKIWFPLVLGGRTFDAKFTFEEQKLVGCQILMRD